MPNGPRSCPSPTRGIVRGGSAVDAGRGSLVTVVERPWSRAERRLADLQRALVVCAGPTRSPRARSTAPNPANRP
jgi:hypothetical protein